jgi:hypothetical protein
MAFSVRPWVEASTCCNNTASEHLMMERLIVDDLVHWVKDYKVDGFRFDLMGHLMLRTIERARDALGRDRPLVSFSIDRFRYIAWVKCPHRVAGKASALRAGMRAPG